MVSNRLICAICPTFNRPQWLGRAIRAFEKQTYENRFLVIIDDAGQYENQKGDRWELISIPRRVLSLGEKRNIGASLAPRDTWAYAVWDDDDLYMPWHLEALVEALSRGLFIQPRYAIDFWHSRWVQVETFCRPKPFRTKGKRRPNRGGGDIHSNWFCYHGCWGYTRDLFTRVGGYRNLFATDDCDFQDRLIALRVRSIGFSNKFKPSYFYNRPLLDRISENQKRIGLAAYWNDSQIPYVGKVPEWTDESEWDREIPSEIIPRPW
jgi:glycosyltransferase involved in cell wall biosynthesis